MIKKSKSENVLSNKIFSYKIFSEIVNQIIKFIKIRPQIENNQNNPIISGNPNISVRTLDFCSLKFTGLFYISFFILIPPLFKLFRTKGYLIRVSYSILGMPKFWI